jgi:hypothetical protein
LLIVLETLAYVPLAISVHSLIIKGEEIKGTFWKVRPVSFFRFSFLALLFSIFFDLMGVLTDFLSEKGINDLQVFVIYAIFFVFYIYVSARVILLFPAIAVSNRRPTFNEAFDDTISKFWFIAWKFFLSFFPVLIILLISLFKFSRFFLSLNGPPVALIVSLDFILVVYSVVAVALASRLYLRFGRRLGARTDK